MFVVSNGYIYFSRYCDDGRARVSIGIKIPKGAIGFERSALKRSEQLTLSRIEDAVTRYVESSNRMQVPINKVELESVVLTALGRTKKGKSQFVIDFNQLISNIESGDTLNKYGKRYSPQSVRLFKLALSYLERFSEDTKKPLTYAINEEWVNAFLVWMTKPKTIHKRLNNGKMSEIQSVGYSKNTIAGIMAYFQSFMQKTYGEKKHNNLIFREKVFSISREEADMEALSEDEIHTLYGMQLTPRQERARDVFVFACWVGLRSIDLKQINFYVLKNNIFEFHTEKTGARVIIPAHPIARDIYEKYQGNMPVFENSNNLNNYVERLCKVAGFTEKCLVAKTQGGIKRPVYKEKWELISIHSARRSFATNAYKAGVPTVGIMKITGHTTEQSFLKYIRISKKENAALLADHPFFN